MSTPEGDWTVDSICVSNFRCFNGEQTARLAPITLLVGENSTGKTSLMAIVRALWDAVFSDRVPNFKEEPYDLGTFDEILHKPGGREARAESFAASFDIHASGSQKANFSDLYRAEVEFGPRQAAPTPIRRRVSHDGYWLEQDLSQKGFGGIRCGTPQGEWRSKLPDGRNSQRTLPRDLLLPLSFGLWQLQQQTRMSEDVLESVAGSPELTPEIADAIQKRFTGFDAYLRHYAHERPFASAPTRSRPRRTYDSAPVAPDSEGDYLPTYMAWLSLHDPDAWKQLQYQLEEFGSSAGLFDEIKVRRLGKTASDPFQIQVRKFDEKRRKGPLHSLVDMGYGVSQVLPLVVDLLRRDHPQVILVQQPEVHLHPSAQAVLAKLLCKVAADKEREHRLIIETHSDFIIDRVRVAARDGVGEIEPDDISILYFERSGFNVNIHNMRVDERGNMLDAPPNYRQFFLEELEYSLGLEPDHSAGL